MTQTAEDIIRARKGLAAPPLPKFQLEYAELLETAVPAAIAGLEKKDWEGGDLALVAGFDHQPGYLGDEIAVWKLSTTIYLTSRGHLAIKVLDPRNELRYEFAEVNLAYLVEHHSMRKTMTLLQNELAKLAAVK